MLDEDAEQRITQAARGCVDAAEADDVAAELAANRRFHFAIFDAIRARNADRLVAELDAHRGRALEVLARVLDDS